MKTKIIIAVIIILIIGAALLSAFNNDYIVSGNSFALDTYLEIKIYDDLLFRQNSNEEYIDESFTLINDLEDTLSLYVEDSDIYNLMMSAGKSPVAVEDITYEILNDSLYFSKITDGLFDITSGPLIDLWAIDPPNGYVPTDDELEEVLALIDYDKLSMLTNNEVMLAEEGMIVNLGAIAKGAIADEVKDYLLEQNVKSAIINLGGNVLTIGNKIEGTDFKVGIQDPFSDRNYYMMCIPVNDMAVVTSGDYERYFEQDGVIYHHILNTTTGYPADNNIKQVTIVAPTSIMADGLSTSVLLLGLEKGIELVESMDKVEAVFVTKDMDIYITDGLRTEYTVEEENIASFTIVDTVDKLLD